ncbi:MAG: hypothetical protein V2A54_13070 [Bacteroidota bacterium]
MKMLSYKILITLIIGMFLSKSLTAQKRGGANCTIASQPSRIITLPFTQTDTLIKTTAPTLDQVNDYDGSNTIGSSGMSKSYMTGRDYLYRFTATQTGPVEIDLTYLSSTKNLAILVFEAASGPSLGQCIAYNYDAFTAGVSPTSQVCIANVKSGVDYFVMVDSWGWFVINHFRSRYTINIKYNSLQTACNNLGFENGDFSNWYGTSGYAENAINPLAKHLNYCAANPGTGGAQFSVVSGGTDALGGFPRVYQGNYSALIGNGTTVGSEGAQLIQSFLVTASTIYYIYHYAMVVQDGAHPDSVQPFIKITTFDENGDTIPGAQYLVTAGQGKPGFNQVGTTDVWYRPWTTQMVDLTSQLGKVVTLLFTVSDCSGGEHYSYAYFDSECSMVPLPVELVEYGGIQDENNVKVFWSTVSETNNDFFTVEKSKNLLDFEIVGKLKSAGNSNSILSYLLFDNKPWDGISYYRLKQTDFDGNTEMFSPISVNFENKKPEIIFNQNENGLFIFVQEDSDLSIINPLGAKVFQQKIAKDAHIQADLSFLARGVYLICLTSINHEPLISKIFLNKE